MTAILLSIKRFFSSKSFIALLLIIPLSLICIAYGFKNSKSEARNDAGIYLENQNDYEFVEQLLSENYGFSSFGSRDELESAVSDGTIDCGFVIKKELSEQLESGSIKKCIEVIVTERSTLAPVYTQKITSHFTDILVPYACAKILYKQGDTGLTYSELFSEVSEKYKKSLNEEAFEFVYETENGSAAMQVNQIYPALTKMILGTLLFIYAMSASGIISSVSLEEISQRITSKRAFSMIIIPYCSVYLLSGFFISAAGIIAADIIYPLGIDIGKTIIYTAVYLFAMLGVSFIISSTIKRHFSVAVLFPAIVTVSAVLCPVFMDLRNTYKIAEFLYCIFPPCWFFGYYENALAYILTSVLIFIIGTATFIYLKLNKIKTAS